MGQDKPDHASGDELELDDVTEPTGQSGATSQPSGPPPMRGVSELTRGILEDLAGRHQQFKEDGWVGGLRCGFKVIDEDLRGLRPRSLNVLNAGPNIGKSTLSNQIAYGVATYPDQRVGVLYATFENEPDDFVRKHIARLSGWSVNELEAGEIPPTDAKVQQAALRLGSVPLYYVYGNARLTPDVLISYIQQIQQEAGVTYTLLILDYLQGYSRFAKGANDLEKIAATLSELRRIAEATGAALLVIGSQNRETNKGGGPTMFGGRGTGDIEYDADTILVLSKSEEEKTGESDTEYRYLHAVKTRFGGAGATAKLLFMPGYANFSEF